MFSHCRIITIGVMSVRKSVIFDKDCIVVSLLAILVDADSFLPLDSAKISFSKEYLLRYDVIFLLEVD